MRQQKKKRLLHARPGCRGAGMASRCMIAPRSNNPIHSQTLDYHACIHHKEKSQSPCLNMFLRGTHLSSNFSTNFTVESWHVNESVTTSSKPILCMTGNRMPVSNPTQAVPIGGIDALQLHTTLTKGNTATRFQHTKLVASFMLIIIGQFTAHRKGKTPHLITQEYWCKRKKDSKPNAILHKNSVFFICVKG